MRLRAGARTDIGRFRERNEDAYLVDQQLFAVADGMGGHRAGDVASTMALEALRSGGPIEAGKLEELAHRIQSANERILERGSADHRLSGMGTTLTAVIAEGDRVHVAHVGDSRAYLLRDENLRQLTEDHTLVQRMVREGRLTPEEAERHPQRSILTKALGVDEALEPDRLSLDVHPGDRLLLCTDGLTGMVSEEDIKQILQTEPDPQGAADALVDAANGAGGDDNITVIVLDVEEGQDVPMSEAVTVVGVSGDGAGQTQAPPEGGESGTGGLGLRTSSVAVRAPEREREMPQRRARQLRLPRPHLRLPHLNSRRVLIGTAIVAVLLVVAWLGARAYINSQWYVGDSGGLVAIYNGIPTELVGFELSHIEEVSNVPTSQAAELRTWRGLPEGITAENLEEARAIVEQIRLDLEERRRLEGR